jgi:MFS family permease
MSGQNNPTPPYVLPLIVIGQFGCTSLWFAGNAILKELTLAYSLPETAIGYITSSVQFGFIVGTLIFALLTISDRFSPAKVFLISAILGAALNAALLIPIHSLYSILGLRFLVGVCLAGIYPVGMKIASDYYGKGLGKSLGYLVGALVLGTAFPHLLRGFQLGLSWQSILIVTSGLALLGGMLIVILGDGPHRIAASKFDAGALLNVFKTSSFRSAAFGYWGHMWELYAFWAFVPIIIGSYLPEHNVSLWSFLIIGIGSVSCVLGGYVSSALGAKKVATMALIISGICCMVVFPILNGQMAWIKLVLLLIWGIAVIMDSPMFSTLVAQNAPNENKGTALTIVNSVGFLITIFSIQLLNSLVIITESPVIYSVLGIGPALGLIGLWRR